MKIQNEPGIYVYFVDTAYLNKKLRWCYFDTWSSFFRYFTSAKSIVTQFGDCDDIWRSFEPDTSRYCSYFRHSAYTFYFYAVYDHNGNWFSPSLLVQKAAEYRKTLELSRKTKSHNRRHGRKKKAWGHYHTIKTLRSNREDYVFPEKDEYDINVKYRRKAVPPDSWDREKSSHQEKCWKKQSKREHQWRAK